MTDGFFATTGIADDKKIIAMQERHGEMIDTVDFSKACRPFGDNCGLVLGESSQFAIVTSLEFAVKIGADILCAVPDVFINSDGIKKSISVVPKKFNDVDNLLSGVNDSLIRVSSVG